MNLSRLGESIAHAVLYCITGKYSWIIVSPGFGACLAIGMFLGGYALVSCIVAFILWTGFTMYLNRD